MLKSVKRGNWGRRIDLRYSRGRQTWSWRFKFFWHMSEKSKIWKSLYKGNWRCRIDLRHFQGRQTWSWRFKFFWHMSEKSKIWKSQIRGNRQCRIDLRYFLTSKFFSKKEKYRYKGKNPAGLEGKRRPISEWWRKKADTRSLKKLKSFGAKRRIQGCYSSGSKEKWGCFLI